VNVVLEQDVDFSEAFLTNEIIEYLPIVLPEKISEPGQRLLEEDNKVDAVRVAVVLPTKTTTSDGDSSTHLNAETFVVNLSDVKKNQIPTLGSTCPPEKGKRQVYDPRNVPESIDVDIPATISSAIVTCLSFRAVAISYHILYNKQTMGNDSDGEPNNFTDLVSLRSLAKSFS
jgi:hypothetical protein